MIRFFLARLRKKHRALWIHLTYLEPFGTPTWCVWLGPIHGDLIGGKDATEIARARTIFSALCRAMLVPAAPTPYPPSSFETPYALHPRANARHARATPLATVSTRSHFADDPLGFTGGG